jgi:hypothetical protein
MLWIWSPAATVGAASWEEATAPWQARVVPSGVVGVWSPPTGDSIAVLSRMGELTVHDFRTGAILSI